MTGTKFKPIFVSFLAAAATLAVLGAAKVDESKLPPPSTRTGITFDKDIKPLFERSCVECHGTEGRPKARLRLDTLEWVMKGAGGDEILKKGKSAESILVHSIARIDEDTAMPPEGKGEPFTKEEVGLVRAWIDQGAK